MDNNNGNKKKNIFARLGGFIISLLIFVAIAFGKGMLEGFVEMGVESGLEGIIYDNAVVGVWETEVKYTEKNRVNLLNAIGLSDKEIELCKRIEYKYVKIHEYNDDGTYRVYYDVERTKENVKNFYEKVQDVLYANRKSLHDYYLKNYKIKIKDMSRKEFDNAVAKLYSKKNYEKMIESFVDNAYNYENLKNIENGTYTMRKDEIHRTKEGEHSAKSIGYTVKNKDTLILEYLDGTETYKRIK